MVAAARWLVLYEMEYRASGSPALFGQVLRMLEHVCLHPYLNESRGLDYGVWKSLLLLYLVVDISVMWLSI
ncbi:hypothetical protein LPH50_10860 [Xylella taiwanensis]|uniref:Uncharacterized protein n=1 Tax=Xylella taiwanensis TaxID=1444770 RepID=Z9JM33_9GAMM|nr:hypothetical protein [Xylella taiwanensis]EWS79229.1 hypothetical protein AF72_01185 [Xylella taiwanensis]MCD8456429.1 hypothetical protein [Xylella taiwanensis]MCD8458836.1 hypothetical protein [Xylella taiwanensis]MCD8460973.1 hypothetical protein [Xylella taiwanensis]MCD8462966.1 hypothetical protein [Xylella taiwanensis]